jgi:hypothetical protein
MHQYVTIYDNISITLFFHILNKEKQETKISVGQKNNGCISIACKVFSETNRIQYKLP